MKLCVFEPLKKTATKKQKKNESCNKSNFTVLMLLLSLRGCDINSLHVHAFLAILLQNACFPALHSSIEQDASTQLFLVVLYSFSFCIGPAAPPFSSVLGSVEAQA